MSDIQYSDQKTGRIHEDSTSGCRLSSARRRAGFTLVEMLLTVLLMTIVLGGLTTLITAAVNVYSKVRVRSEADVLLSTAADAVAADLSTARNIQTEQDGTTIDSFYSDSRGCQMKYTTAASGTPYIVIEILGSAADSSGDGTSPDGKTSDSQTVDLLTEGAQPMGLYPVLSGVKLNSDGTIQYTLSVHRKDGKAATDTVKYEVKPVTQ